MRTYSSEGCADAMCAAAATDEEANYIDNGVVGWKEARIAYLERELRRIAYGNWSAPHIDSASADTYARIADEMQNIAKLALTAIVKPT